MRICECGCNQFISEKYRWSIKYGHIKNMPVTELNFCECKCGKRCKKRFVRGHGRRGKVLSFKHRKNIGLANIGKIPWNKGLNKETDVRLKKRSDASIGRFVSEETKQQMRKSHIGQVSWNKGLSKETNLSVAQAAEKRKGRIVSESCREKQRKAATGKKNSAKTIAKRMASSGKHKFPYTFPNGVIRKMRSSWEVLYAQYLDSLNIIWQYEPKMFKLSTGKYYWPDFYLPELNEYHEIKGYMRYGDKEKMDLFQKEYPYINFRLLKKLNLEALGVL